MKIQVKAIGVNRADVFYRQGKYPVFGLELAGMADDGKRYMAIIDGGAYAETAEVEPECAIEIPQNMSFIEGAAIIEALYTSYYNLAELCQLKAGESVLIHGGASGVGVVAIQLAKLLGAKVAATAGKPEKLQLIKSLGAEEVDYNNGFGSDKYDVILDIVGGNYFNQNLAALKKGGRLAIISFIGGAKADANLAPILLKHLKIYGSTIRGLSLAEKAKIKNAITPLIPQIKPVIDKIFLFTQIDAALDYVEQYKNIGKVVVIVE